MPDNNFRFNSFLLNTVGQDSLNILAVNYDLTPPVNNMEKRIQSFNEIHPLNNGNINKYRNIIAKFSKSTSIMYYYDTLIYNTKGNYLQSSAGYLFTANDITVTIISAVDKTLSENVSLPGSFTAKYNRQSNYLIVTYSIPNFNYTNYNLALKVEGINNNQIISYTLGN